MRQNNKQRKLIAIVGIIFALLLATGLVFNALDWWTDKGPSTWGKKEESVEDEAAGGMELSPEEESGISMTSVVIPLSSPGISPMALEAQQVTATVTPADAEDAVIDWSVAWKEGTSGKWGNGKTVTEYVTVTPTSDGAKTANVQCLKAFGEQIIITAAIRGNASVKGTATADYQQKYSSVTASIAYTNTATAANITWTLGSAATVTGKFPGYAKSFTELTNYYSASGSNKGTYTVTVTTGLTDTYTKEATVGATKIEMAPTAAYISAVTKYKGTISQTAGSYLSLATGTGKSATMTGFDFTKALMIGGTSIDWTAFKRDLKGQASTKMFDIKLTTTVNGQAQTKVFALNFDASSFGSFASGFESVGPNLTF